MHDAMRARGASVARKIIDKAVKPDGESAKASNQPPTVPNTKKNGTYGGRSIPDLHILTHNMM